MSSFDTHANIYLFELQNGKKKLAYGVSPEEALEILASRLSAEEMKAILPNPPVKIHQRDLRKYVKDLG